MELETMRVSVSIERILKSDLRTCLGALATIVAVSGGLRADENSEKRFLTEYPQAARALRHRMENSKGDIRILTTTKGESIAGSFYRTGGYEKVEFRNNLMYGGKLRGSDEVYCFSPDSYFHLGKRDTDKRYQVDEIKGSIVTLDVYQKAVGRFLDAPLGGCEIPIYEIMEDKGFELISAAPVAGKPGIINVRFRGRRPALIGSEFFVDRYDVDFDTNNHWAVVSEKMEQDTEKPRFGHEMKVAYGSPGADGFAMPTRIEFNGAKSVCEIRNWVPATFDRSDFETSYYGLPKIDVSRTPAGWGKWFWGILMAIVIAMMAGLLFRFSSNRNSNEKLA
jgi:hypothetical protein